MVDLTNTSYGVQCFLKKQGFDVSGRGSKINKVMVKFLKEKKLPYKKWNYRYKGLFTADLTNADTIQDHWKEFRQWVLDNKETLLKDEKVKTDIGKFK